MQSNDKRLYVDIPPITPVEAEAIFRGDNVDTIPMALIRCTYHVFDYQWVQSWCVRLALSSDDVSVRGIAAQCLGHLARIHGALDMTVVCPVLQRLLRDPNAWVVAEAEDAIRDIAWNTGWERDDIVVGRQMSLQEKAERVNSPATFARFVRSLQLSLHREPEKWDNSELSWFLMGLVSQVENLGLHPKEHPHTVTESVSWKLLAKILVDAR